MSKRLSNTLLLLTILTSHSFFLSVRTSSISIASFAIVIGGPSGMVSASFNLVFSISTGIIKKLLKTTRKKMKKQ